MAQLQIDPGFGLHITLGLDGKPLASWEMTGEPSDSDDGLYRRAAKKAVEEVAKKSTANLGKKIILDIFGGRKSQVPNAINVDLRAEEGVKASAFELPFATSSVDEVVITGPYIDVTAADVAKLGFGTKTDFAKDAIKRYMTEVARVLKPNGQVFLNTGASNPYGHSNLLRLQESEQFLDNIGLQLIEGPGPLLGRFRGQVNAHTLTGTAVRSNILTTILRKR